MLMVPVDHPGGIAAYSAVILQEGQQIWAWSELLHPEPGNARETSNNLAA